MKGVVFYYWPVIVSQCKENGILSSFRVSIYIDVINNFLRKNHRDPSYFLPMRFLHQSSFKREDLRILTCMVSSYRPEPELPICQSFYRNLKQLHLSTVNQSIRILFYHKAIANKDSR